MKTIKNIQYRYISAQEVINELKNEMHSFFKEGSLDESYLYPRIRYCLGKMGLKIYPSRQEILTIDNYLSKLPENFYKLQIALGCFVVTTSNTDSMQSTFEEVRVETLPDCSCTYNFCYDDCGMFQIKQINDVFTNVYSTTKVLVPSEDARPYCTDECFSWPKNYDNQITIKNGKLYTGFETGQVYIEYLANLETDDGDLMVPENSTIIEWIKDEMRVICFRVLYDNGGDFLQRLQNARNELTVSKLAAESLYRREEFSEWYNLRKLLKSRYHKFNTAVYGKNYNTALSAIQS